LGFALYRPSLVCADPHWLWLRPYFLALRGVFDLLHFVEATNAVTSITLIQTLIYFREYLLTPEWLVMKPVISSS
jgi:hypothetical protein